MTDCRDRHDAAFMFKGVQHSIISNSQPKLLPAFQALRGYGPRIFRSSKTSSIDRVGSLPPSAMLIRSNRSSRHSGFFGSVAKIVSRSRSDIALSSSINSSPLMKETFYDAPGIESTGGAPPCRIGGKFSPYFQMSHGSSNPRARRGIKTRG